MTVGVERERAVLLQFEAELAVELFGLGEIGDHEVERVERMHADLAGTLLHRLGHGADLGHG